MPFVPPLFVKSTWLQLPLEQLSACDLGRPFSRTLGLLCDLEQSYGMANKTRGFSVTGRPAQLGTWIRGGRGGRGGSHPQVSDAVSFSKVWWGWWLSLQPACRGSSPPLAKVVDGGSWEPLLTPGANAMLGPVACLYWWGQTANGITSEEPVGSGVLEEWHRALEDVNYVLEGLIKYNADNIE
ncbi:hypothetical protein FIBSPDRAFT_731165 [Athelia psychrophila]|uniref:Uncharacterized protein n=1 Tax=Athelia psychrophila TaxID=1759441 RepID=A0A166QG22_9AGAM|nr:hypothetical protein FIBSPDRAFT_731165 [Fibularhizoctonia sp. CBS 109695]